MIVNYASSAVNKIEALLTDNVRVVIYNCHVFIVQGTGVNVIKLFPSLLMMRPNKIECLYQAITFQSSLAFVGNTRSLPKKEASERHSGLALALPSNSKT